MVWINLSSLLLPSVQLLTSLEWLMPLHLRASEVPRLQRYIRACRLKVFSALFLSRCTVAVSFNYLWQWASWILITLSLVSPGAPPFTPAAWRARTFQSPSPQINWPPLPLSSPDIFWKPKVIISWGWRCWKTVRRSCIRQQGCHLADLSWVGCFPAVCSLLWAHPDSMADWSHWDVFGILLKAPMLSSRS